MVGSLLEQRERGVFDHAASVPGQCPDFLSPGLIRSAVEHFRRDCQNAAATPRMLDVAASRTSM